LWVLIRKLGKFASFIKIFDIAKDPLETGLSQSEAVNWFVSAPLEVSRSCGDFAGGHLGEEIR
jgi:hypothetical protein